METPQKPQKPFTFLQIAEKVLENKKDPLTPAEIWEEALVYEYVAPEKTRIRDPLATLRSLLYKATAVGANTEFVLVGKNPKKFILRKNHRQDMPTWLGGNA